MKQSVLQHSIFVLIVLTTALCSTAQTNIDSLKGVWNDHQQPDSSRLLALKTLAWDGYLFTDADSAYYYSQVQYDFAQQQMSRRNEGQEFYLIQMAHALNTQGATHYLKGDYGSAIDYYKKSLAIRDEVGDKKGIASSLNNIGAIYSQQNDYKPAKEQFERCLKIYTELGDDKGRASVLNSLGILYKTQGLYSKAIDYYTRSLQIRDELGEQKWSGATLNNIGNIYRSQEDPKKALEYLNRALAIRQNLGDKQGELNSLNNIANTYLEMTDSTFEQGENALTSALENFKGALTLAQELGNKKEIAISYSGIGNVHSQRNEFQQAIGYFEKALKMRQELHNRSGSASSLNNIATLYQRMAEQSATEGKHGRAKGEYKSAIDYSTQSLSMATEVGHMLEEKQAADILYQCYKAIGQHKKALEMHILMVSKRDLLMSEENQREVIRQGYSYDYQKQSITDSLNLIVERQEMALREQGLSAELTDRTNWIKILLGALITMLFSVLAYRLNQQRKKQVQIAESNALKLQTSESEMKALRSQMNPHFIFNALQSIQTFLINKRTDDANEYLLKFSKLMRAVLENSQHEEVPIEQDRKALELYMQLESIRLKHPFSYSIDIDANIDVESETIPTLILQPIVENAIWHGLQHKDESGTINIRISKNNGGLVCTVQDNGIGRMASKKMVQHATMIKESLGMKITEERLKVRNELTHTQSSFEILDLESESGTSLGTKVELIIPTAA